MTTTDKFKSLNYPTIQGTDVRGMRKQIDAFRKKIASAEAAIQRGTSRSSRANQEREYLLIQRVHRMNACIETLELWITNHLAEENKS